MKSYKNKLLSLFTIGAIITSSIQPNTIMAETDSEDTIITETSTESTAETDYNVEVHSSA